MTSNDGQALDRLSSVSVPKVLLIRTMTHAEWQAGYHSRETAVSDMDILATSDFVTAYASDPVQQSTRRVLRGQLSLPATLVPAFHILSYSIEVGNPSLSR
jgi:hypothetical protein